MFIATLFIIVKIGKQPKCPSIDEWIKKIWFICYIYITYIYIYICKYILAIKRMNFCHLQQHGWTCGVLFLVK